MGDLAVDAAVTATGENGRYAAQLSPERTAWGPNGGYVAAILLRAALAHGRLLASGSGQLLCTSF